MYKKQQEIAKLDSVAQQALEQAERQRRQQQQQEEDAQEGQGQEQQQQQRQERQAAAEGWQGDGVAGPAAAAEEEAVPLQQQQQQQPEQRDVAAAAALVAAAAAAERGKLEEESLPLMLDAMWAANRLDIEATLRHVCKRLLNDPQVCVHLGVTPSACKPCGYTSCGLNGSMYQREARAAPAH